MEATHYLSEEKAALQKQVTDARLEAKEAQDLQQKCKLEIDHLQHKLDQRERQLTAAEEEAWQAKETSIEKQGMRQQRELDAATDADCVRCPPLRPRVARPVRNMTLRAPKNYERMSDHLYNSLFIYHDHHVTSARLWSSMSDS